MKEVYFGDQKWFTKTRRDNGKGGVEAQGIKITHKAEAREGEERPLH